MWLMMQKMHELLLDKRDMVDEYFSLRISDEGMVESIPMLIRGYVPDLDRLPHLLVCLATRVSLCSTPACTGTDLFVRYLRC